MANTCESVQGSSRANKPKGLIGLDQKVRWQEPCPNDHGSRLSTTRSICGCLRPRTPKAEHVNPVSPPVRARVRSSLPDRQTARWPESFRPAFSLPRQANRKEGPRRCRTGCWKKRKPVCNGSDTSSEFARRESELTSSWCLFARSLGEPTSWGNGDG